MKKCAMKDIRYVEKAVEPKLVVPLKVLQDNDSFLPEDLNVIHPVEGNNYRRQLSEGMARCVSVDTKLIAPGGRKEKKEMFKAKKELVKFRCTVYEKKILLLKAKKSGLTLSKYCRRVVAEKEIKERLSDEHWEIYKNLVKFHNNFKAIGNMFRKKDPKLTTAVYQLADEIQLHLQSIKK